MSNAAPKSFAVRVYTRSGLWYNTCMKRIVCVLLALVTVFSFTVALATNQSYTLPYWHNSALTIPSGVVLVESGAFEGVNAQYLVVPENVEKICTGAFPGTSLPQKIAVCNPNTILESLCFGMGGGTREIWGFNGSTAQVYAIQHGFVFKKFTSGIDVLLDEIAAQVATHTRYVQGSTDCVCFANTCYWRALRINLPDDCQHIYNMNSGTHMSSQGLYPVRITDYRQLQPGDVICWTNDEYRNAGIINCTHVGIYVGAGYPVRDGYTGHYYTVGVFAESSRGYGYYRYNIIPFNNSSDYYRRNFMCAWRILP